MSKNVLLCGVGGQGTVLASKLLAAAAMKKGMNVQTAETIGMAQRGGSVTSHLRIGGEIYSPLIPKGQADMIIGFEPGEAVRMLPYLKKDGVVIVNTRPVHPVTGTLSGSGYQGQEMVDYIQKKAERVITVDSDKAIEDLGSSKVLNMVLLGAAIESNILKITREDIRETMREKLSPKFYDINLRALDYISS